MGNICEKDKNDKSHVNPITGLTDKDVQNLQKSFAPIYAKAYDKGYELLSKILKAEPELKSHFKFLKDEDEAHYEFNQHLRAHAVILLTALNTIINHLDHAEMVIIMLNWLGEEHKHHKVPTKFFVVQRGVLEDHLKNERKLSNSVLVSWAKFADFAFPQIFSKMSNKDTSKQPIQ